jgi:hypothetical protein
MFALDRATLATELICGRFPVAVRVDETENRTQQSRNLGNVNSKESDLIPHLLRRA